MEQKRKKSEKMSSTDKSKRLKKNGPLFYHFNKISGKTTIKTGDDISLEDIMDLDKDEYQESVHFNYCIDLDWLIMQYPKENRLKPITIVHGFKGGDKQALESSGKKYNFHFVQAKLNIPFGTHHSKMILIKYSHGLRIVIMTANIIQDDWELKTQGIWLSPLFPHVTKNTNEIDFQNDMCEYLNAYNSTELNKWAKSISQCDMSVLKDQNIHLIASVPGRHLIANTSNSTSTHCWGLAKLNYILSSKNPENKMKPSSKKDDDNNIIIAQCSSIGSLGSSIDSWVMSQFMPIALAKTKNHNEMDDKTPGSSKSKVANSLNNLLSHQTIPSSKFHLIFPSVDNVRESLEGYIAGGSLPYSYHTHSRQLYLSNYMCEWKCETWNRTRASPHIKSYARVNIKTHQVEWFILTSANLSKAAWGTFEKNGTQIAIRSYELGILFLPRNPLSESKETLGPAQQILPYDLPLTKYKPGQNPWLVDLNYDECDGLGHTWPL